MIEFPKYVNLALEKVAALPIGLLSCVVDVYLVLLLGGPER